MWLVIHVIRTFVYFRPNAKSKSWNCHRLKLKLKKIGFRLDSVYNKIKHFKKKLKFVCEDNWTWISKWNEKKILQLFAWKSFFWQMFIAMCKTVSLAYGCSFIFHSCLNFCVTLCCHPTYTLKTKEDQRKKFAFGWVCIFRLQFCDLCFHLVSTQCQKWKKEVFRICKLLRNFFSSFKMQLHLPLPEKKIYHHKQSKSIKIT